MIENRLPFASFSLRESPERPEDPFRRDFVAVFSSYFWDDYAESFIAQNFLTTLSAFFKQKTAYEMVHVRNIRDKIEINPREPKYLKVVWGVGYKMEKQP